MTLLRYRMRWRVIGLYWQVERTGLEWARISFVHAVTPSFFLTSLFGLCRQLRVIRLRTLCDDGVASHPIFLLTFHEPSTSKTSSLGQNYFLSQCVTLFTNDRFETLYLKKREYNGKYSYQFLYLHLKTRISGALPSRHLTCNMFHVKTSVEVSLIAPSAHSAFQVNFSKSFQH